MHATLNRIKLQNANEIDLLACIVDAMLEAKEDLSEATEQEWNQILVDSCRRQKMAASNRLSDWLCC